MVHGSGFKVKAMKEGLYSLDKYPVHPIFWHAKRFGTQSPKNTLCRSGNM